MVEYELTQIVTMVSQLASALGVCIAAYYYILNLRNTQKNMQLTLETRQAQLFMQIYNPFSGKEFQKAFLDIRKMNFKNREEFLEKYGPESNPDAYSNHLSIGNYFEGIGMLVYRGLLDMSFVENLISNHLMYYWEKMSGVIEEYRVGRSRSNVFEWVEYLYNKEIEYEKSLGKR